MTAFLLHTTLRFKPSFCILDILKFFKTYLILFALITLLTNCKKYEDGGIVKLGRKHLFGHRKNNATKTWKLKLYEVNGIDSTQLIPGANQIPDFYEKHITFKLDNKEGFSFTAQTFLFNYNGIIDNVYKEMTIGPSNIQDSSQCIGIVCSRNLLLPEGFNKGRLWKIIKLTKKEFIINNDVNMKNRYKLIFECGDK
jgi:hypothetical protein